MIGAVAESCRYGEEEFGYVAVGVITEVLGIDDDFITSELVDDGPASSGLRS